MYVPEYFEIKDPDRIERHLHENSFGQLISADTEGRPFCTHVPFLYEAADQTLFGHFAAKNPHGKYLENDNQVLVVFAGPHGYVSPDWYVKQPAVPTWNYLSVHVYGKLEFLKETSDIDRILGETAQIHESALGTHWSLDSIPQDYKSKLQMGIRVFRINIQSIEAKAKMGQTLSKQDLHSLKMHLVESGQTEMADLVSEFNSI